jgi:hypothetical protein
MKMLDPAAFERARQFIQTEARALDRALFAFRFEHAPADGAVAALSAYRNADGGFGHALEPDVWTPASSALATGIGLQILKEVGCPASNPLVKGAIHYLLATWRTQDQVWRVIPPEANDHPHAPWWHDEDGSLARTFDQYLIIPRAQLVGLLHHYAAEVPAPWLEALTERTVADVENMDRLGTGGGDDLAYALSLAEEEALPDAYRQRLLHRLRAVLPGAVNRDPAEWHTYTIHPLKVIHSPSSPVADLVEEAIEADLDYQIEHQTAEGTWDPVWTWRDAYPDAWAQARLEWRGELTLRTLTILQAFGRISR